MCYIVESKQQFDITSMIATFEKVDKDIDSMKIWITSDYDFLLVTNTHLKREIVPFQFRVDFAGFYTPRITFRETIIKSLNCKTFDTEYISELQCLVNVFIDESFPKCPLKCIPVQMKGFQYVNESTSFINCARLDDEIVMVDQKFGTACMTNFKTV